MLHTLKELSLLEGTPLNRPIVAHIVKILPAFYGNRRLISLFKEPIIGTCPEPMNSVDTLTSNFCSISINTIILSSTPRIEIILNTNTISILITKSVMLCRVLVLFVPF
jgi:hypothetical protein